MGCDISNLNYLIEENTKFERSKVHDIWLQRYKENIRKISNFQALQKYKQYTVDKGQFEFEPDRLLVRALV